MNSVLGVLSMGFLISCPICGGDFKDGRPYTCTSGVVFIPPHPLYEYCDAGLHYECLENWPHTAEFSKGYYLATKSMFEYMNTLLIEGQGWILGCGPAPRSKLPYYVKITLENWPFSLKSKWDDWDLYLEGKYRDGICGRALEDANMIVKQVRELVPNLKALEIIRQEKLKDQKRNYSAKPKSKPN